VKLKAYDYVNYQERAAEFSVGDTVVPFGMFESTAGRVTAVWPAIGMADVEMSTGSRRYPVEDLQRFVDGIAVPTHTSTSGAPTVSVPGGPKASKVAGAYLRKALYWVSKDRQFKMTRLEATSGAPCCPRCVDHPPLKKAIYKRREGASVRLLGCPGCLFLIKNDDIHTGEGV